jgi:stearoyl-CoA desaturase (delta-9 desaturase)
MKEAMKWQHNPKWNGEFSWVNTAFLVATPLLTLALLPWMILSYGLTWFDFFVFGLMTTLSGFAITAGYHRLLAHQSYESAWPVRLFYLVFGAAALQNSALKWCSDHRYHHRFVDKEGDPYNIQRGFFYAHMGWIFYRDPEGRSFDNAKDLLADRLVQWQHRYYLPIAVVVGFGLPTLLGWLAGRPLAGLLVGGLFRVVFVHHGTFLINSAAHTVGHRPYSTKNSARDCWWMSFFTNGESFHNFHHAFGNDYRNGVRWFHWDPSKWLIFTMSKVGLASNLQRTPDAHILRARLESSIEEFRAGWQTDMPAKLEAMRQHLDAKVQEFQARLREFQAWHENRAQENQRVRGIRLRYWKRKLRNERKALELAIHEYGELLRATQRYQLAMA